MLEKRSGEELSGVLSLGLLAERAVLALGRAIRSEGLTATDLQALGVAKRLFERMVEEEVVVVRPGNDQMLSDESYLDALQVAELRVGAGLQARARRYVELLQLAVQGGLSDDERAELVDLRDLLVLVGESTLSRANELSRAYQEPAWHPALQLISLS